nr:TRAP transporter substrate-binding protein [Thaumasiovibrio subtropicus]
MNIKTIRKMIVKTACASLVLAAPYSVADELIFAIGAAQGSLQYKTAEKFTTTANIALKDAGLDYSISLFGDGQLGKDKELMQKLKLGTVHLSQPSSIMAKVTPQFALFDMPFLVKDRDHLAKIESEVFWPSIAPTAETKGYTVLSMWENGFRHISNNTRPITTPKDLEGIKLRTPNSTWRVGMFRTWGGNPTPMSFSEVFVALQTGVIDGQENPLTNIYAAKFNEVQKYLSLTNHVYSPSYLVAGKRTWGKLPEEVQSIIRESANSIKPWMYALSDQQEKELLTKLEQGGMQVNIASYQAFVDASQPIYDQFSQEVEGGKAMLDTVLDLAK